MLVKQKEKSSWLSIVRSTMKLPKSFILIVLSDVARCIIASRASTESTSASGTHANNLLSEPTGVLNPTDQSMFILHEFPVKGKLTTDLRFHNFEEKQAENGDQYWAFLYRKIFDKPQTLGRSLVRGPRRAYHVECAFLGKPRDGYVIDVNGDDDDDDERIQGKNRKVDEDGLMEKMRFDWSELVVADEPYEGIVCRMYFDLDDLKFEQDTSQPYYRALTWN